MDYSMFLRYLLVVTAACSAMEKSVSITDVLDKSTRSSGKHRRQNRVRHGHSDDERPVRKTKKTKSCCLNGGLCIMNSFCHCKNDFYGRRCEHRNRQRSCGTLRHGTWMAAQCHMCHCFDGQMTCRASTIPGCETMPFIEGVEGEPDYNVGFDKKVEDYDKFYEDYTDITAPTSASPTLSLQTHSLLVTAAVVTAFLWKNGS